jgi:quercetin dioxygenase-like cupin family protein
MDWGTQATISSPLAANAKDLMVLDVIIYPGKGHSFHRHPRQEEVIYVLEGEVEQWIEGEKRVLTPGDSAFIDKGLVHASFNRGQQNSRILAILGPCIGEQGYEIEEVEV